MAPALEPAFASGGPVWPLAGMSRAAFEPDDPDLAIPQDALRNGLREKPERLFPASKDGLITCKPVEPLGPGPAKTRDLRGKWKLALVASCFFHAAAALLFLQATDEAVLVEGSDFAGVALLGNPDDQVKAGEVSDEETTVDVTMVTMLDAVPVENVEAEAVPTDETAAETEVAHAVAGAVEALKPVDEAMERVEAVTAEPLPARETERVQPETPESGPVPAVAETAPEVLATDRVELVDDDNVVPMSTETQAAEPAEAAAVAPEKSTPAERVAEAKPDEVAQAKPEASRVETRETAKAVPAETSPIRPVEDAKPTEAKAERKPAAKKAEPERQVRKKAAAEKKSATAKKASDARKADAKAKQSGNRGKNQTEARRGQSDGQDNGDNRQASRGGSKKGQVGNAAVSNYPGKVRSKLARVARSVRAKGRGEVVVAFAVGSNGGVRSARVTRSSGVASVDQAALQAIRKASPFPPIPENAGRSSWEFSIPLAFLR